MLIANEGVTQALTDLEGIRSAAERGHYTPAQAPAVTPQQFAVDREVFTRGLETARRTLSRDNMARLTAQLEDIASNMGLAPTATELIGERSPDFIAELRHFASMEGDTPVGRALTNLADRIEPQRQAPGPFLPMTVPQLDQFLGDTYRDLGTDIGEGVRNVITSIAGEENVSIAQLLSQEPARLAELINAEADNTVSHVVEERLRELARILTLPDIDFGEPAPAQRVFGEVDFDNFVADIRQNVDAQVAHDIVRISNTVADGIGTNVRGALENYPTAFATRLAEIAAEIGRAHV